jgi:aryl-alcohol dehydrogenase-like predicted oxidoreductase
MNSTRLVLGTVQMGLDYGIANRGGRIPLDEVAAVLDLAKEQGIDRIDTASAYGEAEATLGRIGMSGRKVITKLRPLPAGCADVDGWVRQEVAASLRRLGLEAVYGLLLHRADDLAGPGGEAIYAALNALQGEGQIGRVGVSIYGPEDLDALVPRFELELVQTPFNLLDRRIATSGWLDRCRALGVEVHGRSAFLQGALLMKRADRPPMFARWAALWASYEAWLARSGLSPVEACLLFALAEERLDGVVVGVDGVQHLRELIAVAGGSPPREYPDLSTDDLDLINPARWKTQ